MTKENFSQLVLASEKTLYGISMSMLKNEADCEDVVQTAILTAYEKLDTLKHEEYFRTWLVRILINICNKQLRRRGRIISMDTGEYMTSGSVPSPAADTEVRLALDALDIKFRQVIVLYYIEEFSVSEIKTILGIPEGTVKSRLSKGRALLKALLA